MQKTASYIIAAILVLLGLFYAILPHSVHIGSGIGFGLGHTIHIGLGVVLIIAAIAVFAVARKA